MYVFNRHNSPLEHHDNTLNMLYVMLANHINGFPVYFADIKTPVFNFILFAFSTLSHLQHMWWSVKLCKKHLLPWEATPPLQLKQSLTWKKSTLVLLKLCLHLETEVSICYVIADNAVALNKWLQPLHQMLGNLYLQPMI